MKMLICVLLSLGLVSSLAFDVNYYTTLPVDSRIIVYERIQWSTNGGMDWNEELPSIDDQWAYEVGSLTNGGMFRSEIITAPEHLDVYAKMDVRTVYCPLLSTQWIPLATNTFYVHPADAYDTNTLYRPVLTITNYMPIPTNVVICTNCDFTNLPPSP